MDCEKTKGVGPTGHPSLIPPADWIEKNSAKGVIYHSLTLANLHAITHSARCTGLQHPRWVERPIIKSRQPTRYLRSLGIISSDGRVLSVAIVDDEQRIHWSRVRVENGWRVVQSHQPRRIR